MVLGCNCGGIRGLDIFNRIGGNIVASVFEWLFDDFWRFLMFVVILIIAVQWRPVNVDVLTGYWKEKNNESD